jgi:hypothetical protein
LKNIPRKEGNSRFAKQYELDGDPKFTKANGSKSYVVKHEF